MTNFCLQTVAWNLFWLGKLCSTSLTASQSVSGSHTSQAHCHKPWTVPITPCDFTVLSRVTWGDLLFLLSPPNYSIFTEPLRSQTPWNPHKPFGLLWECQPKSQVLSRWNTPNKWNQSQHFLLLHTCSSFSHGNCSPQIAQRMQLHVTFSIIFLLGDFLMQKKSHFFNNEWTERCLSIKKVLIRNATCKYI